MEQQYLDLLKEIRDHGVEKTDPHGVGSRSVFVRTMRFRLDQGVFPVLTTKKVFWKSAIIEMLWFLTGESRIDYLHDQGVKIWDSWATKETTEPYGREVGDPGPIYGPNWRRWKTPDGKIVDQIAELIKELKENPDYRRHKVTAWNPGVLENLFIAPCHGDFKCYAADGKLSLHLNQRSGDVFIGIPFNIAQYSALTMMIAQLVGLEAYEFVHTIEDAHIYLNHLDQVDEQLGRKVFPLPTMTLDKSVKDIDDFKIGHFKLENYQSHDYIKAPVAI